MRDAETKDIKKKEKDAMPGKKYYTCKRCGYVTIIRDSYCPICAKDGLKIKMK